MTFVKASDESWDVSGPAIELACRLEPVVPPEDIWVTQEFAGLVQRDKYRGITFDKIGARELAKNSGIENLSALRWKFEGRKTIVKSNENKTNSKGKLSVESDVKSATQTRKSKPEQYWLKFAGEF